MSELRTSVLGSLQLFQIRNKPTPTDLQYYAKVLADFGHHLRTNDVKLYDIETIARGHLTGL
jgi:hypothetical protein